MQFELMQYRFESLLRYAFLCDFANRADYEFFNCFDLLGVAAFKSADKC